MNFYSMLFPKTLLASSLLSSDVFLYLLEQSQSWHSSSSCSIRTLFNHQSFNIYLHSPKVGTYLYLIPTFNLPFSLSVPFPGRQRWLRRNFEFGRRNGEGVCNAGQRPDATVPIPFHAGHSCGPHGRQTGRRKRHPL